MEKSDVMLQPGVSIKPAVNFDIATNIFSDLYGLDIETVKELNGYDDKNYYILPGKRLNNGHMTRICDGGYVLKIINSLDSKKIEFFEAQTALLIYLGQRKIKCSKPIKTKHGDYFSIKQLSSGDHIVRLLEYLDGTILAKVHCTNELFYDVGKYIATLDNAMQNFSHPAYKNQKTVWMMNSVPKLKDYLFAVKDQQKQRIVENVIDQFTKRVLGTLNDLEKGIIHGDFNEQNIILKEVNGKYVIDSVIDFGDSHYSCYLFELAITMTYMIIQGQSVDVGRHVLAGYCSVRNLPEVEYQLLKICIEARMCQSLVLGAYSIMDDPNNLYILSTAEKGWKMLMELSRISEYELLKQWKDTSL